ncbi:MAG: hypothetical protein ACR2O8_07740 [Rhizobiaceae bacterium]
MYPIITDDLFGIPAATANMVANGLAALVAIFVLITLYRLFTRPRMASGRRSKNARLAITDAASIDDRRRLVLLRRDDVEHLIMIGGPSDLVIESDIRKNAPARSAASSSTASSLSSSLASRKPAPAKPEQAPAKQEQAPAKQEQAKAAPARPEPAIAAPVKTGPVTAAPSMSASASKPTSTSSDSNAEASSGLSSSKSATASAPDIKTTPPPTASAAEPGKSAPSSLIGSVSKKPDLSDPAKSSSVGDNMDALLNEITPKK